MAYNPNNPNGQATMANSAPVVIASNQTAVPISDNAGSITVDGSVTVSGTVTANAGTGTMNVSVQNASIPVTDNGGSLTVDNGGTFAVQAAQSGTWNINNVSGTISLPTGAATSANQTTEITSLQLLDDVVATDGSAALTKLYQVGGTDGTNAQILSTNTTGHLNIADGGNSITVDNGGTFAVQASQTGTWNVGLNAGSNAIGSITNTSFAVTQATAANLNATVTGTVAATQSGTWSSRTQDGAGNNLASSTTTPAGTEQALIVRNIPSGTQTISGTITANAGTGTFVVGDGGGSLTIDGAVSATQSGTWILGANSGVDIGDVTINNAGGASAVNIQDGGNTITVDGTVSATQSGTWNIGTLTSITNTVTVDTELPTASALADGASNPTTPTVGSAGIGWNGTTWDRLKTSSGIDGNGAIDGTGVLSVKITPKRINPANLGTATNSAVTVDVHGYSAITVSIATTTTGTFVIEGTGDNTNWGSVEVFDIFSDSWVSGQSITPTLGKVYNILCSGLRQIRIRTNATLGATVSNFWTLDNSNQFLAGIDTGAAPHNFGYTLFHVDVAPSTQQTSVSIRTTTTGKRFAVTDLTISTGGTTAGVVTIYDAASATAFSQGTTPAIFRGEFAPSSTVRPGVAKSFNVPYVSTTASNNILLTTSAAMTLYIQINGYEI